MTSIHPLETWIGVTQRRWAGDQIVHDILASWQADRVRLLDEKEELLKAAKAAYVLEKASPILKEAIEKAEGES